MCSDNQRRCIYYAIDTNDRHWSNGHRVVDMEYRFTTNLHSSPLATIGDNPSYDNIIIGPQVFCRIYSMSIILAPSGEVIPPMWSLFGRVGWPY